MQDFLNVAAKISEIIDHRAIRQSKKKITALYVVFKYYSFFGRFKDILKA